MLGDRIKTVRKQRKLTQDALSEKANVPRETISRYESGKQMPDLLNLIRIADVLDVSLDYLTSRSNSMEITAPIVDSKSDSKPAEPFVFTFGAQTFPISDEALNKLSEIIAKRLEEKGQGEKLG